MEGYIWVIPLKKFQQNNNQLYILIMEKFIELFAEALEREDEIKMDDEFRDYPEWSSIVYLSVIAMMDEEYGIQIEEADFKKLRTVQAVYDVCTNHCVRNLSNDNISFSAL